MSPRAAPAPAPPQLPRLLKQELCAIVARQSLPLLFPVIAAQAIAAAVAFGRVPDTMLGLWLAALAAVHTARMTFLRRMLLDESQDVDRRVRAAVVMSTASGVVNAGAATFLPFLPLPLQAITSVILLALCAGCVAVNVGYLAIVLGFMAPILASLALFWFAFSHGTGWESAGLSVLVVFFGFTLLFLSRATYNTFERSVAIRLENLELAGRLESALARAEAASRAKTRFLAAASHDLRQPLNALSLEMATLKLQEKDPQARETVAYMARALESLAFEFHSLLDISKLDAGVMSVSPSTFEIGPFLGQICQQFAATAKLRRLEFETRWPEGAHVCTDEALFGRIVRNLVDNAFKYTPAGRIVVCAAADESECCIQIGDTGLGIPAAEHERVFEEFYQLGNPERDRAKGLGLGLPIVRRLAELLEVHLEMESSPGEGTRFRLSLPRAAAAPPRAAAPSSARDFRDVHVLVIDDEAQSREAMQRYLEAIGCDVTLAATVNEAAALAQMHEPDCVLADYRLRGNETGLQAIELLRRDRPGLPAMIVTGDTAPERLAEIDAARIPVLHKPVPPGLLIEKIAGLLDTEEVTA
jgi:signal transduction histidine kinase